MKKILFIFTCVFLFGCTSSPKYYDSEQVIQLKYPEGITLQVGGYEPDVVEEKVKHLIQSGEVKIDGYLNKTERTVKRSSDPLIITLSKEGFEDKKIELESHLTDEKWAEISTLSGKRDDSSVLTLLVPMNTPGCTGEGFVASSMGAAMSGKPYLFLLTPIGIVVGFVVGVGTDIYNIVWGIPSTIITNPWYEYNKEVDLSHILLHPTPEFETECHNQKGKFIGRHECLSCKLNDGVIATEQECNRCSNRELWNGMCVLKCPQNNFRTPNGIWVSCGDKAFYKTAEQECKKCSNRDMYFETCAIKCPSRMWDKNGKCIFKKSS